MTVKITFIDENRRRVVRIDGWLTAGDVAALEEAMEHDVRGTQIDLTDLRSADDAGRAALRGLEARGAELWGTTPYLRLLLGDGSGRDGHSDQEGD